MRGGFVRHHTTYDSMYGTYDDLILDYKSIVYILHILGTYLTYLPQVAVIFAAGGSKMSKATPERHQMHLFQSLKKV